MSIKVSTRCNHGNLYQKVRISASLPGPLAALIKALRPTVENNKTGYCWPYCNAYDGNLLGVSRFGCLN